jgi:hypothetical protein
MRQSEPDLATQEAQPGRASASVAARDERARQNEDAVRYVQREHESEREQRKRALAALDAADIVVWRLLRIAVWTISVIIALAILFHLLNANLNNSFVSTIDGWGHTLAGPFAGMFLLHSAKATIALDYAIAIVVYVCVAELIIHLIDAAIVPARRKAAAAARVRPFPGAPPSY